MGSYGNCSSYDGHANPNYDACIAPIKAEYEEFGGIWAFDVRSKQFLKVIPSNSLSDQTEFSIYPRFNSVEILSDNSYKIKTSYLVDEYERNQYYILDLVSLQYTKQ